DVATAQIEAAQFERARAGEDRNLPPAAAHTARPATTPAVQPRRERVQPISPVSSQPVGPTPAAVVISASAFQTDDLTRIRVIDRALQISLNKLGVLRYRQITAWMKADILRMNQAFGFKGRIEQENWIEQAQILANQDDTLYARRLARGEAVTARASSNE